MSYIVKLRPNGKKSELWTPATHFKSGVSVTGRMFLEEPDGEVEYVPTDGSIEIAIEG